MTKIYRREGKKKKWFRRENISLRNPAFAGRQAPLTPVLCGKKLLR